MRLRIAVLALLVTTTPSLADDGDTGASQRYQAPSEPPMLLPWNVGQWASYELQVPTGISTINVVIVAEDTCGFWLDIEVEGNGSRADTRFCVARTPNQNPSDPPSRIQFEVFGRDYNYTKADEVDEPLASRKLADTTPIFDASWSGQRNLKREDVTTPAGTFVAALAQTAGIQRWSHPEVPITGVIRQVDGTATLTLTSFGVTRTKSALRDEARQIVAISRGMRFFSRSRKMWMMYALGSGYFGTVDTAEATTSLGFSLGFRVGSSLALVFGTSTVEAVPYAPKPELFEDLSMVHAGLRWFPYTHATGRWSQLQRGIYLQGDVGFAQMRRGDMDVSSVVGRGVFGGARLGITTGIVHDWKLALELTGHGALLNADEGTRINLGLLAVIELYMPTPW